MTDLLIRHVIAVTIDPERRVIDDAAIAVTDGRIAAIGPDAEVAAAHRAADVIEAHGMAAIPGLIDCHSHAGHGLVRSLGAGDGEAWFAACGEIYARGSTVDFWRAEARLAQLERLKADAAEAKAHATSQYNAGWHEALDLKNLFCISEAIARSALLRAESRGGHTRVDFEGEREDWGKVNVVCRMGADGEMIVETLDRGEEPEHLSKIARATLEELEGSNASAHNPHLARRP